MAEIANKATTVYADADGNIISKEKFESLQRNARTAARKKTPSETAAETKAAGKARAKAEAQAKAEDNAQAEARVKDALKATAAEPGRDTKTEPDTPAAGGTSPDA